MRCPSLPGRRQAQLRSVILLAVLSVLISAFSSVLFTSPLESAKLARRHTLQRGLVQARAGPGFQEENIRPKVDKKAKPSSDPPLPFKKYVLGSALFFGVIGFVGGGPLLAVVFLVAGAGFGNLFEPFVQEGDVVGWGVEEE
mmetsp:Transcript_5372/g.11880  ORF Transcript_5372/g.11880 Transcript_5372/m.11880 type:complete len:142 (-) Transcript_5372:52-477(-)|eukprot:CAMPEP_0178406480 /NCGR_PEP_ID=MMETSP0689_2-20121128/18933_1 /TAXON_ID=160604 /ORGANISM="Amphidinium massartii, Strain CS-259" /LENGTH=141 /DNA_ID=CAMNT_0020027521 /DNA_START=65 /DNA_END=490 /DNA_ORIENTATION=-